MTITTTGMVPLVQVYDMPEALAFYRDVLGFEILSASPVVDTPEGYFSHWIRLRLGNIQLMLNTAYDEGQRPMDRVAAQQRWHDDTCLYFDVQDVDAIYAALHSKLPEVEPPKDAHYGMRQLYLHDPDGYGVCFQTRVSE